MSVLLALLALAAGGASAVPSCGIDAAGVAAIRAKVAVDPRYKRDGGDALRETWSADSIQAILTFTLPKNRVYPAALCEQVVTTGGTMQIGRHLVCEASAKACAAFEAEVKSRDDGSGDPQ